MNIKKKILKSLKDKPTKYRNLLLRNDIDDYGWLAGMYAILDLLEDGTIEFKEDKKLYAKADGVE